MKTISKIALLRCGVAPVILGAALLSVQAFAQDTPATADTAAEETIVVTGSRIPRPDLEASSPVSIVSAAEIKTVNTVTVEQILSTNPRFSAGTTSASNNPGDGAATVDLRGLGAFRTLVLLDGKRLPLYDSTGSVDVNQIPVALISRVDVLTGGASAVYGSDAISGVVNFVLNDKFTGLQADASSQITGKGDGGLTDISLTGGVKLGDRGNLVVSAGYAHRNGVKFGARDALSRTLCSDDLTQLCGSSNTIPTAFDVPGAGRLQVTDSGDLTDNVQTYNFNPVNYAQVPFERYNIMALARYELTDGITFYGRANYQKTKVITTLAPTATAGFFFNIDPSNPFLSNSERDAFFNTVANPDLVINDGSGVAADPTARAGTSTIGIRRRIVETGGRVEEHETKSFQVLGGFRGDFGSSFHWDVSAQYAEVKRNEILRNDLSYTALQQALDVVAGPNGPACFDPSNGCVPLNLFGTTPLSQNALAFVIRDALQNTKTTQFVAEASLGGDLTFLQSPLASLPAAFSVGADYRRETAKTSVDDNFASGDLIYYGQGQNIAGNYNVKEAYIELKMPLIDDKPFIESLNVEAGYRISDYSTSGRVSAFKAGGDWSPVNGLRFRGIYQRAVRAPSVYELFSPVVAGTASLGTDPCAGANVPADIVTICRAQGAPASSIGNIPQPIAGQVNGFFGGNPNLAAEKSDTFTAGVVINPPSMRRFTAAIDYYSIKIGNAITSVPASITIAQCFNVSKDANSAACKGIVRNALDGSLSGPIDVGVPATSGNVAAVKTRGVDVDLSYFGGDETGFHYRMRFAGTYVIANSTQVGSDTAAIECAGHFGADCDTPLPKWKHVADLTLGFNWVDLQTRWRYIGHSREDGSTDIQTARIPAVSYFDETATFNIAEKFTLRLGVLNVFNKQPPIIGDTSGATSAAGGTFPTVYDVLGRSVFAGVTAKF